MISVLVPVFNCNVVPVVTELSRQLQQLDIEGEIRVADDFSSTQFREGNKAIAGLPFVDYKELDRNHGRSAIRQLLASGARFEWLLFLDSDGRILHPDFLKRYISTFEKGFDVITGGRVYPQQPGDCNKMLHWTYGVKRESPRGKTTALHTNNFCIRKALFQQIHFPGFLEQYGHEDSWMEIELERMGRSIHHIDNPVEHTGLEESAPFLKKTEQALQNLLLLQKATDKKTIARHVTLFRALLFVQKYRLQFAVRRLYGLLKNRIHRNLHSCHPSLFYFDLYRLHLLIKLYEAYC